MSRTAICRSAITPPPPSSPMPKAPCAPRSPSTTRQTSARLATDGGTGYGGSSTENAASRTGCLLQRETVEGMRSIDTHLRCAPLGAAPAEPVIFPQTITVSTSIPTFSRHPVGDSFDALRTLTVEFHVIQFFEDSTLVKEIRRVDTTAPSTARIISPRRSRSAPALRAHSPRSEHDHDYRAVSLHLSGRQRNAGARRR